MKYRLKDICSITKGATGIMKADGGKYPLVALGEERRSHSEYQFDAKAVIVPLISSTGHGHASMKRVHYQEGKFALGNILCAVIPNDETQLHPKYLHLYLQQFKESLLVPLMKGAANVSLPMNKLADVEIEVPSLERQLEIITLEEEASELKNELEARMIAQDDDVKKLRLAIYKEAVQGKLVKQEKKDGSSKDFVERIKNKKNKLAKKEKPLPKIKEEEIPFEIPDSWTWSRLGELFQIERGSSPRPKGDPRYFSKERTKFHWITIADMTAFAKDEKPLSDTKEFLTQLGTDYSRYVTTNDIIIVASGSAGRTSLLGINGYIYDGLMSIKDIQDDSMRKYIFYLFKVYETNLMKIATGAAWQNINTDIAKNLIIPIPPLPEQHRIVKKIEQLMQLCDDLQYSIQQSKIENEKLLQGALRDALKKEESVEIM